MSTALAARHTKECSAVDAVLAMTGRKGRLLQHTPHAWASITFEGARHHIRLLFVGDDAVEAGEDLIMVLPEHEFSLRGQLVIDAAILSVESVHGAERRLTVELELLVLEEQYVRHPRT